LEALWLPVARSALATLAKAAADHSARWYTAGRGCVILDGLQPIAYRTAAWTSVKGKKGHLPQDVHCALIARP